MDEMISYCGLSCHDCAILLAVKEKDLKKKSEMRVEIARQIKEHYGMEAKPENITDCDGCKAESGRIFSGSNNCKVRKCAKEKVVETCAHCDEYACDKLQELWAKEPHSKERLDIIRNTL